MTSNRIKVAIQLVVVREIGIDPEWYQNEEQTLSQEEIFKRVAKEVEDDPGEFTDCSPNQMVAVATVTTPEHYQLGLKKEEMARNLYDAIQATLGAGPWYDLLAQNQRLNIELSKMRDRAILAELELSRHKYPDTTGK
jgi:hypothetical protein